MKKIYPILLLTLLTSCLGFRELPVDYDYSYQGNFKKYRTYDMMKPLGNVDSTMSNSAIEKSIASRMKFLGYKQTQSKPHLIVSYKMFYDSLKFRGYEQPDIEAWIKNKSSADKYEKRNYKMRTGTLLIQFYDRRQNRSIWQGYATEAYGEMDFANHRHLRNAVISILDKYKFWADGFIEQQAKATETENNP